MQLSRTAPFLALATLAALGLGVASAQPAQAQTAAFSFTGATFYSKDKGSAELGYDFTTGTTPVSVTALGYINDGADLTHTVQIFDVATKTALLATPISVTTSGGGPASTSFSYTVLSVPLNLAANTHYQIVSQFYDTESYFIDATGLSSADGLTIGNAVWDNLNNPATTLTYANNTASQNNPGDFGPNMLIVAPEPSTWLPFAFMGLAATGLILKAKRRHV